ncbi:MerR family transcriptional regulator [Pseudoclavibacter endophyticus]|uniref:MerR family transcriptional regulator n=1 Tax=Pseudoclavibacter endophyticus TaxID=1778590 RepID=A0A6H9WVT0_9MICO|nr:MerR family transcriptional regulator [Pseudoclavibacter endophyticus]KAB1650270.1 MerR family transcriptional regulator [Pseudoclavibacter endophyticus]GGA55615.1 MerR family transcriptional regulator [Pseudoclavibacter endophyticus]
MAARAAASSGPAPSTPRLSIGQVLQRLCSDFPDLTSSKLRFFEDKGLLHPARSASGYRKYSTDDVDRIRRILTMQRDLYLPLKVIGEYLDQVDRGLEPELPGSRAPRTATMLAHGDDLDRGGLLERTGATGALLDQAVAAGLIGPGARFSADDATMLATLVELDRSGIGPRHLRPFKTAAQHELGLVEQVLPPAAARRSEPGARERADERAGELAELLSTVRRTLVRQGVRELLGGDER